MIQELEEIATEHEGAIISPPSRASQSRHSSSTSPSSSMASSRIVGVLEVDAKGKKLKLNLRRNVSPEDLVSKFLSKHKLPQKFFNPLMGKVQLMLENAQKREEAEWSDEDQEEVEESTSPSLESKEQSRETAVAKNPSPLPPPPPSGSEEIKEQSLVSFLEMNASSEAKSYLDSILYPRTPPPTRHATAAATAPFDHEEKSTASSIESSAWRRNSFSEEMLGGGSVSSSAAAAEQVTIKVKLSSKETALLVVKRNSDPSALAKAFILKHNLPQSSYLPILTKAQSSVESLEKHHQRQLQQQQQRQGRDSRERDNEKDNEPSPRRSTSAPPGTGMTAVERLRQALNSRKDVHTGAAALAPMVQQAMSKVVKDRTSAASSPQSPYASSSVDSASVQSSHHQQSIDNPRTPLFPFASVPPNASSASSKSSNASNSSTSLSPMQSLSSIFHSTMHRNQPLPSTQQRSQTTDFSIVSGSDRTAGGAASVRIKLPENQQAILRVPLDTEPIVLARDFMKTHHLPSAVLNPLLEKIKKTQDSLRTQQQQQAQQQVTQENSQPRKVSPAERIRQAMQSRRERSAMADVVEDVRALPLPLQQQQQQEVKTLASSSWESPSVQSSHHSVTDSSSTYSRGRGKDNRHHSPVPVPANAPGTKQTTVLSSALQRLSQQQEQHQAPPVTSSSSLHSKDPSLAGSIRGRAHSSPSSLSGKPPPPLATAETELASVAPPTTLSPTTEKETRFNESLQRFKALHFSSSHSGSGGSSAASNSHRDKDRGKGTGPFNLQAVAEIASMPLPQDSLLSLDVRVNERTVEKLEFRPGESPYGLAAIFVAMHKLPTSYIKPLASEIQSRMSEHLKQFPPQPSPSATVAASPPAPPPAAVAVETTEDAPRTEEEHEEPPLETSQADSEMESSKSLHSPAFATSASGSASTFRRSLADSVLSPPRLFSRPTTTAPLASAPFASAAPAAPSASHSDDKSQASGRSSLPSQRSQSSSSSSLWRHSSARRDSSSVASATSHLRSRDSLSIASASQRRSRSVSPLSQGSSSVHDRLFQNAKTNADRREKFKSRLQLAEEKDRERSNKRRAKSVSGRLTSQETKRTNGNGDGYDNPGEALYHRELKRQERHQRDLEQVRQALENQAAEREQQECSFRPILFTKPQHFSRSRPSSANASANGPGNPPASSCEGSERSSSQGSVSVSRRAAAAVMVTQAEQQGGVDYPSFQPLISQKSTRLAERRRKKRFYGAAAASVATAAATAAAAVAPAATATAVASEASAGIPSSPSAAATPVSVPVLALSSSRLLRTQSVDGDDGYHSAREGGEDFSSRRSSLETLPSPLSSANDHCDQHPPREEAGPEVEEPQQQRQEQQVTRLSVFEMLYEERKLMERSKEASVAKYAARPSFHPDIGIARHRIVETNVQDFSQRLYEYRICQQHHLEELETKEMLRYGEQHRLRNKRLPSEDIHLLNKRMQENGERYRERREERREKQKQETKDRSKVKCVNEISNRLVQKNRRAALEEIFRTLLLTVDYAAASAASAPEAQRGGGEGEQEEGRGQEGEKRERETGGQGHWQIVKAEGEEAYELCLLQQQDSLQQHRQQEGEGEEEEGTAESSLTGDPGDSLSATVPRRNLSLEFNQPEMREGTRASSPSPSASSDRGRDREADSEPSAHFYFRGERLAKAAAHSSSSQPPQSQSQRQPQPQLSVATSPPSVSSPISPTAAAVSVSGESVHREKEGKPLPPPLLDTSRAMPEMLKPPSLCEAVTMVLEATAPGLISLEEFVECFEVLLESGLAPPLNMFLGIPQPHSQRIGAGTGTGTGTRVSSIEREVQQECRPVPQLCPGKRGMQLRERSRLEAQGRPRHEQLYHDDAVIAKRKEEMRQQLLYEDSKELTFQPTLFTKRQQQQVAGRQKSASVGRGVSLRRDRY